MLFVNERSSIMFNAACYSDRDFPWNSVTRVHVDACERSRLPNLWGKQLSWLSTMTCILTVSYVTAWAQLSWLNMYGSIYNMEFVT